MPSWTSKRPWPASDGRVGIRVRVLGFVFWVLSFGFWLSGLEFRV